MKFKKTLIITIFLATIFLGLNVCLAAGTFDQVNTGFGQTGEAAGYPGGGGEPTNAFSQAWAIYISNFATGAGAGFFLVLIIYGGWLWMSAQGDDEKVNRAKKIIIGSTIGLIIIISGRIIAELVITYLGKAAGI